MDLLGGILIGFCIVVIVFILYLMVTDFVDGRVYRILREGGYKYDKRNKV